jgi:hypothetical protein
VEAEIAEKAPEPEAEPVKVEEVEPEEAAAEAVAEPVVEEAPPATVEDPVEEKAPEIAEEPAVEEPHEVEAEKPVEAIPDAHVPEAEPAVEQAAEPEPAAEEKPVTAAASEKGNVDIPSIVEDSSMVEAKALGYIPDAYLRDIVENYAKNIAVKVKLIKVFRDGAVKEETFTRLFNSYQEAGKIWQSRLSEQTAEVADKIADLEDAYAEAERSLELLEVRKAVGDASEEEYAVKIPAVKWDLNHLDLVISESRKKQAYLESLGGVISKEELAELRESASLLYNTVDALHIGNDEAMVRVKETLYEAIRVLG